MISQKEYFNNRANDWDQICQHDISKVKIILDLVEIQAGQKVLDVGTGTGVLIPELSMRVSKDGFVKAIDVSDKMIEIAQKKHAYKNVIITCEDALDSVATPEFDHVICYSMFPHFPDKQKAIFQLSKRLLPGGRLSIAHSQSRDAINSLHKKTDDIVKDDNLPKLEILKSYFMEAGLRVIVEIDTDQMFMIAGNKL